MSDEARPVALVTGGGRGIGAELARTLADRGFAIGLIGRDETSLTSMAATLDVPTCAVAADVTSPGEVTEVVETMVEVLGPIDLLVNNAGVREQRSTLPWDADPDDWWRVLEVNMRGVFLMTSAVLPAMIARGSGRILDLGSGVGQRAEPRYSAYSVSKGAALHWMANVAAALGDDSPVRVISVSPGVIRTDMTETMWEEPDASDPNRGFGSTDPLLRFVRRFADGDLDHLHGQFVHAVKDGY